MISITRLPQAKKNLEQDLKRVYDSVYERYVRVFPNPLEDKDSLFSLTEDELIDKWIIESNDENLTDEEHLEIKQRVRASEFWKAYYRFICQVRGLKRYLEPCPKVGAAMLTFFYDLIVHIFLFSNWRWKDEEIDLSSFDLSLTSDEVYQIFQNVNPDVAYVFISKLENCSIAEKELLQEALERGQKKVFIDKLKALSISDYNSLVLISTLFHLENALMSNDWETLRILLYIDFEESLPPDVVSILPSEKVINMMEDDFWERVFNFEDDLSEEEVAKRFNAASDKVESNIDLILHLIYGGLKYHIPEYLDTYKLFPFEKKYVEDILNDPDVKAILDELPENPDEFFEAPDDQEHPKSRSGNLITEREPKKVKEDYVPHWPTDEELAGYDDNYNTSEYFPYTIFGPAGHVKASEIKILFEILSSEYVLDDNLETQLIFLARYSGKIIPGLVLRPLKWAMVKDRDAALGFLILKTANGDYANAKRFFYFDTNGTQEMPTTIGPYAHNWDNLGPLGTSKKPLKMKLDAFLENYEE